MEYFDRDYRGNLRITIIQVIEGPRDLDVEMQLKRSQDGRMIGVSREEIAKALKKQPEIVIIPPEPQDNSPHDINDKYEKAF